MAIKISKAGFMTTIQDGGRPGYAHLGIPASGFMDLTSGRLANRMLGNDPETPLLEVDVAGIGLTVQTDCSVAIAGAQAQVTVNQQKRETSKTIDLFQGDQLVIESLSGGMWTYLAFAGGLVANEVLGSCSTLAMAQLGGFHGRRLQKGDVLSLAKPSLVTGYPKPPHKRRPHNTIHSLAILHGPEFDLFSPNAQRELTSQPFTMTEHISRQGMKMTGPKLKLNKQVDINSSGLVPGSLQVTPGGEYIITHRDSQTTGGYPRMAVLCQDNLDALAQVRPGENIYFYVRSA